MKFIFNFILLFSITLGDLIDFSIIHLNDDHGEIDYKNDNSLIESEQIQSSLPKITVLIAGIKTKNNDVLVLNTGSFTNTKWSEKLDDDSVSSINKLGIDYSVSNK